jgi:arylsulfatase
MVEHDMQVGQLMDKLAELGISDNTIVMYSTDNGAETFTWPDGGTTVFRGEKNTTWEGGFRVPTAVRWPARIQPAQVSNELISHQDWIPTLLAAAGNPNVKEELVEGRRVNGRRVKVHLDGYNFLPYFTGEEEQGPREEFFYFTDDGSVSALRFNDWKINFTVQRAHGADVWSEPYVSLRLPMMQQLRMDPFERAQDEAISYGEWSFNRLFLLVPAQVIVRNFLTTFQEFPPRQKPGSFSLDRVLEELEEGQPK